ncbi:hypothetical protein AB0C81_04425 [Streptomyces roseoverticillatus]|uniref:hypothetical protein n=1 Tax=Streptomyces roseoverticillatus TaxID=66429 RepID=UPI0033FE5AD1
MSTCAGRPERGARFANQPERLVGSIRHRVWSDANHSGCTTVTSSGPTGKGNFFPTYRDSFSSVQFDGPGGPGCGTPPGEGG